MLAKYRVQEMLRLIPAALPTAVTPYAITMAVGFLVGVYGHLAKSRLLIVTGIALVGITSAVVLFGVAKVG
jgi:hypothetical protein